ncbi:hypothetical protein CANARDRAFT_183296, partial [[Candida] arabinofermentans NRRL YB-2248]
KSYFFYGNPSSSLHSSSNDDDTNTGPNIVDVINEINDDRNFRIHLNQDIPEKNKLPTDLQLPNVNEEEDNSKYVRKIINADDVEEIRLESFLDTEKTYKDLIAGGFTEDQSEVILSLISKNLENKLQWLNRSFVPTIDLENEEYLFDGAHSELLVEIKNNREVTITDLTNSSIILKRAFNSLHDETSSKIQLNDNSIKMNLNQFKHENNLHQKQLNLKNQDLINKIISELMSGLRSDIESFRWQLTRSGIMAIILMGIAILGGWNLTKKDNGTENGGAGGGSSGVIGVDEPVLKQLYDMSDEESADYEADWDEDVQ